MGTNFFFDKDLSDEHHIGKRSAVCQNPLEFLAKNCEEARQKHGNWVRELKFTIYKPNLHKFWNLPNNTPIWDEYGRKHLLGTLRDSVIDRMWIVIRNEWFS